MLDVQRLTLDNLPLEHVKGKEKGMKAKQVRHKRGHEGIGESRLMHEEDEREHESKGDEEDE